ncbi:amino acid adenylation domain-containing protein [Pseudarthrobacter oxydans]|uniref:amino acid adenylation domain-containing protein n=1 Tax=Pseudarthrobacter oxydans TaxID=1671 RepID=UPI003424103B
MTCLHDLLRAQAAERPESQAAVMDGSVLTYREYDRRADEVARALVARGVRPGERVALVLNRSLDLLPALLGLLRSGAVCIPIDPEDPSDRRTAILEQSGARILITEGQLAGELTEAGRDVVVLNDLEVQDADLPDVDADATAFIFYTSGSTGVPKGVILSHRALVSGQRWLHTTFPLEPGDRQLLRTTLSITNIIREVFWPLLAASTVVIVPPGAHRDPERTVALMKSERVTTLVVVPALFSAMLTDPTFPELTALKYVFCSSDVFPGSLPERYFATGLSGRLFNLYGLTEALYSTCWECIPGTVYRGFVPVGSAAELTPLVLDGKQNPVVSGEEGELCLTGVGIASRYDGLTELTRQKFIEVRGQRIFRTGDLARVAEDGTVELLGRLDDQVKVGGHRVELGEVENALRALPGVRDAAVSSVRDDAAHQKLFAYVVPGDSNLVPRVIREGIAAILPPYMVPARVIVVDALPYTHNGKVDRQALADLVDESTDRNAPHVAPRNELESIIADLWTKTLGLSEVSVEDNFFMLGGDSIQGFMISAAAQRRGLPLSATQVFATPTVAEMATHIEVEGAAAASIDEGLVEMTPIDSKQRSLVLASAADPAHIDAIYRLTEMQKGMLFHSLLDPGSGVYFEQFLYKLDGVMDIDGYRQAWEKVVERHEILRIWIAVAGLDEPLQIVQSHAELEWSYQDLSSFNEFEQAERLEELLTADRARGFAYEKAPLFRILLVRVGPATHRLVLSYHHLILDAWSLFILLRDSLEFYAAASSGRTPEVAPTRPFGDYVAWLEREDTAAARDHWMKRLAGFRQATAIGSSSELGLSASAQELHAEARLDLGAELSSALIEYGRRHLLTLNSLVQASWACVVAAFSGESDVCFGITITHRPVALTGVEDVVGIFINSLPMRVLVDRDQPMRLWIQSVQDTQVAGRTHDHYPLPEIQARTELPSGQPLFESLLIFENFPKGAGWSDRAGLSVEQERYIGWTNYPFAIEAMPDDDLYFQVKYDLAFFDADRVEAILEAFRGAFKKLVEWDESTTVGDIVDSMQVTAAPREHSPVAAVAPRGSASRPVIGRAAETEDESTLAAIWAHVLGRDTVPVDVPFLELGGTSLQAMRIAALAGNAEYDFELADLFDVDGTIERLAGNNATLPVA